MRLDETSQRFDSGLDLPTMRIVHWVGVRRAGFAALAVLILVYPDSTAFAQAVPFDKQGWLDDYRAFKQALERQYANLAWFASPEGGVDLPALDRRTTAALQSATSDDEARATIQSFVRAFHDGHFSQLTSSEAPLPTQIPAPANPAMRRTDAATGCAALNFGPYDLPQFSLPFEALPGFRLVTDGITTPFRTGVIRVGADSAAIGVVRIASFEETSDQGLCRSAWLRDDVWDAQGTLRRARLRQIVQHDWYATLADRLRTFQREGVTAVLVDVGTNSGGDDSGDIAARLFTSKALRSASLYLSRDSSAATAYIEEELGALRRVRQRDSLSRLVTEQLALFLERQAQLNDVPCPMSWVWNERRAWSATACNRLLAAGSAGGPLSYLSPSGVADSAIARELHWPLGVAEFWGSWSGPLFLLTNGRTFSAAEMFVAVLRDNHAATVVGTQTGGDGCGFMGRSQPVSLPHSGMRFQTPNCVRARADGSDEVAGIKPDILVAPAAGENARARAARVLNLVLDSARKQRPPAHMRDQENPARDLQYITAPALVRGGALNSASSITSRIRLRL
jgi:hypothetical protein